MSPLSVVVSLSTLKYLLSFFFYSLGAVQAQEKSRLIVLNNNFVFMSQNITLNNEPFLMLMRTASGRCWMLKMSEAPECAQKIKR